MQKKSILDIHSTILRTFNSDNDTLVVLQSKIEEFEQLLSSNNFSRTYTKAHAELSTLKSECVRLEKREDYYFYILNATPIVERYKDELSRPICIRFVGDDDIASPTNEVADALKNEYMKVVSELHSSYTSSSSAPSSQSRCSMCQQSTSTLIKSTNTIACTSCGTEQDSVQFTFSYKDTDRINISTKYTYDRKFHFKECISQFQGKQNSTIKPIVYEKLIEQFVLHGLASEDETIPRKERFKNITKNHISIFLKEINCSHHYEDLNLIYHNITTNKLDDISYLEDILLDDFDKLSGLYDEEYIKTKRITRKNFINTQYVLYQLLKRHKYPCVESDFIFLKTIERIDFHDKVCLDLFTKLGWNFTHVF